MLAALGFATIAAFLFTIMTKRLSVLVALILIPTVAGLLAGAGADLGKMMLDGIGRVAPVGVMIIFAVLYFGFCQGSRHCPWPTRAWLGIGPASHRGVDEDAVYRMWLGSRDRATRAHRPGLPPVPLSGVRQAVQ